MSFVHLVFVGDFERDGEWIRYANSPDNPILKPVVRRPIDLNLIRRLAGTAGAESHDELLLASWGLWLEDGYLGANRYALTADGINFIARVVASGAYQLVDDQGHLPVTVEELVPVRVPPPAEVAALT